MFALCFNLLQYIDRLVSMRKETFGKLAIKRVSKCKPPFMILIKIIKPWNIIYYIGFHIYYPLLSGNISSGWVKRRLHTKLFAVGLKLWHVTPIILFTFLPFGCIPKSPFKVAWMMVICWKKASLANSVISATAMAKADQQRIVYLRCLHEITWQLLGLCW